MNLQRTLIGPEMRKVCGDRGGITSHKNAEKNQSRERERLGRGENILNEFAELQSARIREREEDNQQNRDELLPGKAQRILRRNLNGRNNPRYRRNSRREHTQITR